jgi:predicted nucleic acid-binding protein
MILYAETSAVLAWLLGEPQQERVRAIFSEAEAAVASVLTVTESERALIRAEHARLFFPDEVAAARKLFRRTAERWYLVELTREIRKRAERPFPAESVRTIDAIHLATALELARVFGDFRVATLDRRIRKNLVPLGLMPAL